MKNLLQQKVKQRKIQHFRHKKLKNEAQTIEVPGIPERFKEVYKGLEKGEKPRGNEMSKPNRFSRSLNHQRKLKDDKQERLDDKHKQEEMRVKRDKEKKKTANFLSVKNSKGQPKLGNLMKHMCDKLGIK